MNHLGIYTGILYISHMNHIGMLYRNHMFQDTQMLLTCGGDINVATIQLLCGYHTTPMWLPYRNYCVPHGSCMVLYATIHSTNVQGISPIQLPYGYHTTLMWLPHSFCMTTLSSNVVHSNSHTATIHKSTNMQGSKGIPMWLPYNSGMATIQLLCGS